MKNSHDTYITICPKCNSTDVKTDFSNPTLVATGLFNNSKVCNDCGYSGNFFPEVQKADIPPKKKAEKRDYVNTTAKNMKFWWKISGPAGIVISIFFLIFYNMKFIFYLGLVGLLPISCILTLSAFGVVQRYRFLRTIAIIIILYTITIAPIVIMKFSDMI